MTRGGRGTRLVLIAGFGLAAASLAACGDNGSTSASTPAASSAASQVFPIYRVPYSGQAGSVAGSPAKTAPVTTPPANSVSPSTPTGAVTVTWEPPTQNSDGSPLFNLSGYQLHYGRASGTYSQSIKLTNPGLSAYVVQNLPAGTYYFAISSYNSAGTESPLSAEVSTAVD